MIFQIVGFLFGSVTWLKNLVIGDAAPLRVIQDSVKLLGYVLLVKYNRAPSVWARSGLTRDFIELNLGFLKSV